MCDCTNHKKLTSNQKTKVNCSVCGKETEKTSREIKEHDNPTCSKECLYRFRSINNSGRQNGRFNGAAGKTEIKCDFCGVLSTRYNNKTQKNNKYNFCNKECRKKWTQNKNSKIPKKEKKERNPVIFITKKCDCCFKEISRPERLFKNKRYILCSNECKKNFRPMAVKINCDFCNKEIIKIPSQIKNSKFKFCNVQCQGKWNSENLIGENHPAYINGQRNEYGGTWHISKKKVKKRDKHCKICSKEKEDNGLNCQVHHYIPFRLFGDENHEKANHLSNLGLYCCKCHNIVEKNNQLFWTQEYFDSANILETHPSLRDPKEQQNFHCYSIYK